MGKPTAVKKRALAVGKLFVQGDWSADEILCLRIEYVHVSLARESTLL